MCALWTVTHVTCLASGEWSREPEPGPAGRREGLQPQGTVSVLDDQHQAPRWVFMAGFISGREQGRVTVGTDSVSSPLRKGSVAGAAGSEAPSSALLCQGNSSPAPAPVCGGPEQGLSLPRGPVALLCVKTGRCEHVQTAVAGG